jgi:4-hydroxybenzoyl-CoA thioesterase
MTDTVPHMYQYTYQRRLHWSECDPGGIIFFPHYARWMVEGLNDMFLQLGVDPNGPRGPGALGGLPVLALAMKFISAPTLHEMVTHQIDVTRLGGKSLTFRHRFLRGDQLLVEAEETRVWAEHPHGDPRGLRATPIPDQVRALLQQQAP